MEPILRGRFAPSPSGRMHLGNLFSALLAWLSVRRAGGVMVLRMEEDVYKRQVQRTAAMSPRFFGGAGGTPPALSFSPLSLERKRGPGRAGPYPCLLYTSRCV